jgi:tetratricopeptide (TPR) repeat protein
MINNILKKIFGKSDQSKKNKNTNNIAFELHQKSAKFLQFLGEKSRLASEEFFVIKEKCKDLRQTNYNLGLKHIEKGNLFDAIFRFYLIKKFWPDFFDAYYQLAYCLLLNDKPQKAEKILQELLAKKPDYDQKAYDLLERITSLKQTSQDV